MWVKCESLIVYQLGRVLWGSLFLRLALQVQQRHRGQYCLLRTKTNGVQVIIFWFLAKECVQLTSILSTVVLDLRTLKMEFAPDEPILLPKVVQMTWTFCFDPLGPVLFADVYPKDWPFLLCCTIWVSLQSSHKESRQFSSRTNPGRARYSWRPSSFWYPQVFHPQFRFLWVKTK